MEDRQKLNDLLPLLDALSRQHPDDSVREMATDLRIAIATHGHVLSDALRDAAQKKHKTRNKKEEIKVKSEEEEEKPEINEHETKKIRNDEPSTSMKKKPLIEVISSHDDEDKVSPGVSYTQRTLTPQSDVKSVKKTESEDRISIETSDASGSKSELDVAFEELMDPLSKSILRYCEAPPSGLKPTRHVI